MTPLLVVDEVTKRIGGTAILDRVTLRVNEGEIVALMGPNGSGKTTLLNVINRIGLEEAGHIRFRDKSLLGTPPYALARLGIGRTFQGFQGLEDMIVSDHVALGAYSRLSVWEKLMSLRSGTTHGLTERVLKLTQLNDIMNCQLREATHAQRKYVQFAQAISFGPRLLILDELTAGLSPTERSRVAQCLEALKAAGVSVLMIEHDVSFVLNVADRCVLLDAGCVRAEGPTVEVLESKIMKNLYLSDAQQ